MNENIETRGRNLLLNCANAKAGERLLPVGEHDENPCFDPRRCDRRVIDFSPTSHCPC